MNDRLFFGALTLVLAWASSAFGQKSLEKIYLDSIRVQYVAKGDGEIHIEMKGNFPTPAYSFHHCEVKVQKDTITVVPYAEVDRGKIVAQVVVPFRQGWVVKSVRPGKYVVRVVGRTRTLEERVKVKRR